MGKRTAAGLLLLLLGCGVAESGPVVAETGNTSGAESSSAAGTTASGNSGAVGSTDGPSSGTTGTGGSSGEVPAAVRICRPACDVAADCATGPPPRDEANWECRSGGCVWLGCLDASECSPGQECVPKPNDETGMIRGCAEGCSNVDECGIGLGPFVPANYECGGGVCIFTGCSSTAECTVLDESLGCFPQRGLACLQVCMIADDCSSGLPAFDADNYECVQGICIYQGCNDDECDPGSVCRAHE